MVWYDIYLYCRRHHRDGAGSGRTYNFVTADLCTRWDPIPARWRCATTADGCRRRHRLAARDRPASRETRAPPTVTSDYGRLRRRAPALRTRDRPPARSHGSIRGFGSARVPPARLFPGLRKTAGPPTKSMMGSPPAASATTETEIATGTVAASQN